MTFLSMVPRCFLTAFLIFSLAPAVPHTPKRNIDSAHIEIRAEPIAAFDPGNPSRRSFGSLEFRGGLVLTSPYRPFGGFSAMRIERDGSHFIALSDRAFWLRGTLVYAGDRPAGIEEAEMAPVLDSGGRPAGRWDTESIARNGGDLYVGVEGLNSVIRFKYGKDGLLARGKPISVPPGIKALPHNQGLEALEYVPKGGYLGGSLIALSERGLDKSGNIKAFLIGGKSPGRFSVKRTSGYDISDAALIPGGDLLILERRLSLLSGISMRIRRIPLKEIGPAAVVDGPVLIEADLHCQVDNMEALSVFRTRSGRTVLTLMSDDNFSPLQRTLLLQFTLRESEGL